MTAEAAFERLVTSFAKHRDVTPPTQHGGKRGFGASALRVGGKIFAFRKGNALVVKLPAARVAALIKAGEGTPFGAARPMKEWIAVSGRHAAWPKLARAALAFVRSGAIT